MLRLISSKTGKALPHNKIGFSASSEEILAAKAGHADPKYDRAMELGSRCGDILLTNIGPTAAQEVSERLAEGIEPPERAEAWLRGAQNAIWPAIELEMLAVELEVFESEATEAKS